MAGARQARRRGRRRAGERPLRPGRTRPDRRLRRLSARDAARRSRPRRWRCSAISSPATKCGARRSTPIAPASTATTTKTRARPTRTCARSTASASSTTRSTTNPRRRASASISPSPLARKTDFTPYVAVAGAADAAISAEDQQICVEGVKHGERYAIVLREGLPSAVGEVAAQGRRLRGLCARPLAAGAFRRQAPMCCRARASSARR